MTDQENQAGYGAREKIRFTLDGNADAVEFCPPPSSFLLAAATYTLHESRRNSTPVESEKDDRDGADQPSSSRVGSLSLFTISAENEKLRLIQRIPTSAIFDIKWRPHRNGEAEHEDSHPFLAQASSDGTISLYCLQMKNGLHQLREITKRVVKESMCLSIDWDPHSKKNLAVSHSDGTLSLVHLEDSHIKLCETSDLVHGFEAWTISYDSWKPHILYSGADDCHFCCWDLRQGLFESPVFRDKKKHRMGVCSIQTSPHEENILVTGSYDEHIRVWDMRLLAKPVLDKSLGLGGGVWKLKWSPFHKHFIAAACMHNGFAIVKIEGSDIETVVEYKKHESLAYGIDWYKALPWGPVSQDCITKGNCRGDGKTKGIYRGNGKGLLDNLAFLNESLLASCSFYDRSLHLWQPNLHQ